MGKSPKSGGSTGKVASANWFNVQVAVMVSFLAWPLLYLCNNGFEKINEENRTFWMMVTGFCILAVVPLLCLSISKVGRVNDYLLYVLMLFAFTSMIDLIIAMEYMGLIRGFMSQYLALGEPYLHSPWGSAISLFDGTGFFFLYLVMIHQISNGKSWRETGVYWGAALINSMVVLLLGIFSGKHAPTFCAYLNAPYAIVPLVAFVRLFGKEKRGVWRDVGESGVVSKMLDVLVALGMVASIWVILAKGLLSLGSEFGILLNFLQHERCIGLDDPAPFVRIQNLVFLFYILPIQLVSLFYVFRRSKPHFLWDMGLVHSGTMLQAQFSFIVMALDPNTPKEFQSNYLDSKFWVHNLTILIVPHVHLILLSLRHRTAQSKKND